MGGNEEWCERGLSSNRNVKSLREVGDWRNVLKKEGDEERQKAREREKKRWIWKEREGEKERKEKKVEDWSPSRRYLIVYAHRNCSSLFAVAQSIVLF